jgi:hypothetical protein
MRNSEHIKFVRVFWYIDSPTNLQEYYKYFTHSTQFPTAHNCSNQTVFCLFHSRFFTAAFPQPAAHSSFCKNHGPTKHTLEVSYEKKGLAEHIYDFRAKRQP